MESLFQDFAEFARQNIHIAPYLIFGLLLLAGFNIPVSEDGMLFLSGVLASAHPEMTVQLFLGVFLGAYISDLICYGLGHVLGEHLWKIKWLASMASKERMKKIHGFYERYGVLTLIFGRFVPFGVRNALFLSAGMAKMRPLSFALSDLLACSISVVTFFSLYYHFGDSIIEIIKKGNVIIFAVACVMVLFFFLKKKFRSAR